MMTTPNAPTANDVSRARLAVVACEDKLSEMLWARHMCEQADTFDAIRLDMWIEQAEGDLERATANLARVEEAHRNGTEDHWHEWAEKLSGVRPRMVA